MKTTTKTEKTRVCRLCGEEEIKKQILDEYKKRGELTVEKQ